MLLHQASSENGKAFDKAAMPGTCSHIRRFAAPLTVGNRSPIAHATRLSATAPIAMRAAAMVIGP